jgi:dTDP-4-amino-4,6-dideoxygalactose transaminase
MLINIHEPKLNLKDLFSLIKIFFTKWIGRTQYSFDVEEYFAKKIQSDKKSCIGVNSCTEGLFVVMELIKEEKKRGEVIIPSLSFVGMVHSIKSSGLKPVFCDVSGLDYMSPSLEQILEKVNEKTVAVLLQNYGGRALENADGIYKELKKRNISLILDCATSIGTTVNNHHVGSQCDFSVWSFDPLKTITSGDGGMIYCKNQNHENYLRKKIYLGFSSWGGTYKKSEVNEEWWIINPEIVGRRSILNNLSSSLLHSQLKQSEEFVRKQNVIAKTYRKNLKGIKEIKLPVEIEGDSNYIFWIQAEKRNELANYLKDNGIFTTFRYYPNHLTKLYKTREKFPITENLVQSVLCLPCHKNLSKKQVKYICKKIKDFFES